MNKLPLFLVISFLSFSALSLWNYKRLNKLKNQNPTKCISVAKRHIKLFPENATSYYFVSVVYFDHLDESRNLRAKYIKMGNALLYARKFEKYSDDELRQKVSWDDVVAEMQIKSNDVMASLKKDDRADLARNLRNKLDRLEDIETIELVEIKKDVDKSEELTVVPEVERMGGYLYGLPSGEERINSDDLDAEKEMLALINAERKRLNMGPLELQEDMARACR